MGGYEGNLESWKSYGDFSNLLNKDRDILEASTVELVKKMVENIPDKREKVKRIYEYMQSKTRYVSIQLGIGGWQTLPADLTDKKGYGDCKALSNYTKAMLKNVGIESHYTIIRAGENAQPIDQTFPSAYFNHIILCVPIQRDTVWLECTSQQQPFNFLGSFTADRACLLVTENGGEIVRTPKYTQEKNTQTRTAYVKMLATNDAEAKIVTTYAGLQTENNYIHQYIHENKTTQKKWLTDYHLTIPQYDLISFDFKQNKTNNPSITETLTLKLNSFGAKNGKRIFITPNLMNKSVVPFDETEKRLGDINFSFPDCIDVDTVYYELPDDYHVEGTPKEFDIKTTFGEYKTTVKVEQGKITYIRRTSMRGGMYKIEKYQELLDFYKTVSKADNTKIVLIKST